jgi:hypothetical protein
LTYESNSYIEIRLSAGADSSTGYRADNEPGMNLLIARVRARRSLACKQTAGTFRGARATSKCEFASVRWQTDAVMVGGADWDVYTSA